MFPLGNKAFKSDKVGRKKNCSFFLDWFLKCVLSHT